MANYSSLLSGAVQGANNPNNIVSGAVQGVNQGDALNSYPGLSQVIQGATDINSVITAAAPFGQSAINAAVAAFNSSQQNKPGAGTLSSYPTANLDTQNNQPQPQNSSPTVVGQLTPEQQAWNNNIMNGNNSNLGGGAISGGSGGGGSGGGGSGSGSGLNLAGIGPAPVGSTAGNLTQFSSPNGPTVSYQNPGSVNNTNTVGYIQPGATNNQGQAGVLQMQPANAQSALDQYKNTAGYQLLNAPGAYQASPGYQYAMDQAMQQVNQNAASRGMLESGAVIKQMQQTASGLAQQEYNNWWNRQNQLYGDYQNRLQGLASGPTGSADAMTTGANAAQANLQTGSNLGSLFGNQGTSGMGGIINTAAAQSGNMINAGQQQASVNAANQSTQLAGATLANNHRGLF